MQCNKEKKVKDSFARKQKDLEYKKMQAEQKRDEARAEVARIRLL